jgi:NAD(P)-dependent dehydrogenase (short-subunit alcohol dehydrogenase family)
MNLGLEKKVVLITGGTKGNGRAVATCFASERAVVSYCDNTEELFDKVTTELREKGASEVLALKADVTKQEEIARFVEITAKAFGKIDILVNNAIGAPINGETDSFEALSYEHFSKAMERKFLPYAICARYAVPYMIKQGGGRIISIAGNSSVVDFGPGHLLMACNNISVLRLTTHLACHLAKYNIMVNAINPGPVETSRWNELIRQYALEKGLPQEEVRREHLRRIPVGSFARPEDIGDLVVFLASERASYITGAVINVDGGMSLRF